MSDIAIFSGIVLVLVAVGVLLPFIKADFGESSSEVDVQGQADDLSESSGLALITSVASMFVWNTGLWWPIQLLIFVPLRIVLYTMVARWIWPGGGG